jgi:hypothetical protein
MLQMPHLLLLLGHPPQTPLVAMVYRLLSREPSEVLARRPNLSLDRGESQVRRRSPDCTFLFFLPSICLYPLANSNILQ